MDLRQALNIISPVYAIVLLIVCQGKHWCVHANVCVRADNISGMEAPSGQRVLSLSAFLKAKYRK